MVIWNKKYIDIDTKCRLSFYARFFFLQKYTVFFFAQSSKKDCKNNLYMKSSILTKNSL